MGSYRELETAKYMNLDSESDVSYPPPETSPHLTTANQFASDNTQPASLSSDSQPSPEESSSKGKTWILVIGIALMGLGGMGVFNALNDRGEVPEKREDITTEGTVTDMTATQLKHQIGVTLSTTYRVEYAFRANDGEIIMARRSLKKGRSRSWHKPSRSK